MNVRSEWINLFQQTGEKAVDSIGTLNSIEIPFQKEVEFKNDIIDSLNNDIKLPFATFFYQFPVTFEKIE